MNPRLLLLLGCSASLVLLSGCSIASGYTDQEKEMVSNLTPSKYQPATRDMRSSIETQDMLAQAAFWSREYQLNPADLEAAVKLASSVRKMGNPGKALEITQTTRALYPNDPYLIAEHSAALIALERGSEAVKTLDIALKSAPGYARLWSLKGAALDQIGQYDLAKQHYNRALQINPGDPNVMANMGLSYALAGDPAQAEKWLRQAANHPEANDSIRQNLDIILKLQGKAATQSSGPIMTPRPRAKSQASQKVSSRTPASGYYNGYSQPMRSPTPTIGHRSNMTVVGQTSGAPQTSAEMARAVASQSQSSKIVVPHQPQVAGAQPTAAEVLANISRSHNQKQLAAQQLQMSPRVAAVGSPYPATYQGSSPQAQNSPAPVKGGAQTPSGPVPSYAYGQPAPQYQAQYQPQYQNNPTATARQPYQAERRGAARRR